MKCDKKNLADIQFSLQNISKVSLYAILKYINHSSNKKKCCQIVASH